MNSKIIYSSLFIIGVAILLTSIISQFYIPLLDLNISKVLIPMSFIYTCMIVLDYLVRGKNYNW